MTGALNLLSNLRDRNNCKKSRSLYFVTWNVATNNPEPGLHQLFGINETINHNRPDLYIVGFQEVESNLLTWWRELFNENRWTEAVSGLLKDHDYVRIKTQKLQGMLINVFCLRKHVPRLRSIEASYTKTGFGGFWGNKGAVSVRLNLYGVSLCLVSAHLAPHDEGLEDRISHYHTILRKHVYENFYTPYIFNNDYVFWSGDLNFRLESVFSQSDIISYVKKNEFDVLLAEDQLIKVRASRRAFAEFEESKITFPPTFKYNFGSQEFNLKRRPAWTDRILFKVNSDVYDNVTLKVVQHTYKSYPEYTQSDHKPVSGTFDIVVRSEVGTPEIGFLPISKWHIGQENVVSYKHLGYSRPGRNDWIGVYKEDFSSIDEYLDYEYIHQESKKCYESSVMASLHFGGSKIKKPGKYRLVYVSQVEDTIDIMGISQPFPASSASMIMMSCLLSISLLLSHYYFLNSL